MTAPSVTPSVILCPTCLSVRLSPVTLSQSSISGPDCFTLRDNELLVKENAAISESALRKRLISITVKVGDKKMSNNYNPLVKQDVTFVFPGHRGESDPEGERGGGQHPARGGRQPPAPRQRPLPGRDPRPGDRTDRRYDIHSLGS